MPTPVAVNTVPTLLSAAPIKVKSVVPGTNILYLTSAFRSGTGDQKVKVDCTKTFGSTNSVTSSISL